MRTGRGQVAQERARVAVERARRAAQRAADLHERLELLAAGRRPSTWTLDAARVAVDQSVEHAEEARLSAVTAYLQAAAAHRSAAGAARGRGEVERARQHEASADADALGAEPLAGPVDASDPPPPL